MQENKSKNKKIILSQAKKHYQIFFQICFVLNGLVNNLGYVVSLSAAKDILGDKNVPTSTVLLCDVLPSLLIKFIIPYLQFIKHSYKLIFATIMSILGFIFCSICENNTGLGLTGVCLHSLSSGIGEPVYLQYIELYFQQVRTYLISGWAIGTGIAGVLGSFLYAVLRSWCSPQDILLGFLIFPFLQLEVLLITEKLKNKNNNIQQQKDEQIKFSSPETIKQLKPFIIYLVSLFLVYLCEYTINQSLDAVIEFSDFSSFYTYSQFCYQLGVLISRSTLQCFVLSKKYVIIPSLLQVFMLILFSFESVYLMINNYIVMLCFCVIEGLFGGLTYISNIYWIGQLSETKYKQFNQSFAILINSLGIVLATPLGSGLEIWFNNIKKW